jgi:hypothetical protein
MLLQRVLQPHKTIRWGFTHIVSSMFVNEIKVVAINRSWPESAAALLTFQKLLRALMIL